MATETSKLEPIEPPTALDFYLDHKETSCSDATVYNHRYHLKPFVERCEENEVENLNEISGRDA